MGNENPAAHDHEGERYLRLLGLAHLANETIPGRTEQVRDFLDICGDHARPLLVGLETLDPNDPRFALTRNALRGFISQFVKPTEE